MRSSNLIRNGLRFLVLSFVAVSAMQTRAAGLPNLVVFLSDDLGRLETSIHGSPDVRTPTMDRLAADGVTFENAYVASPSCCPNRHSLLTGLMPARHGAHPNHSRPKPGTRFLLPILQQMGYYVASFGKVAHGRGGHPGCDFNSPSARGMYGNVVKHFADKQIDAPLCLLVGDRRPHVAWTKKSVYDPKALVLPPYLIDTPETREHWARYLSDITGMDAEMGQVYEFARERFGNDFIFMFSSDHGGQWPFGKWNLYDSGTRVPLIVSWPGRIAAGTRTDAMVSWIDLIPTLIDLAGGSVPSDIDGKSFSEVLLGHASDHRDKIFTTHTGDGAMNVFPMRSVRIGNYKFIHNLTPDAYHTNHSDRLRKDGAGAYWDSWDQRAADDPLAAKIVERYYTRAEFEFFDLAEDPLEESNLIGRADLQATISQFKRELSSWTSEQGDDLQPHRAPYPRSEPLPDLREPRNN